MIVYDVTNTDSFDHVKESWVKQVDRYCNENVAKMMIGNKIDDVANRMVSYDDGKALADSLDYSFYETSAKTSTNVEVMFVHVAKALMARGNKPTGKSKDTVNINGVPLTDKPSGGCCVK